MVAGIVALVVIGIGGGLAWWFQHRGPSQPSIPDAVGRLRSSGAPDRGAAPMRPRRGVYVYAGRGREQLSFMATHQSQDGDLPGTVTPGADGCWTFTMEFNSFHRQTWRRCVVDGRLIERGNATDQKFDFGPLSQSEHTEIVCDPPVVLYDPAAVPGQHHPVRCRGRSQTTKASQVQRGRITLVGHTTVVVGGTRVPAAHLRQDVTITGDQRGSDHEDLWIATADGLPLRDEHRITVESPAPAPLNQVTYSEHGSWLLTTLEPRN
jgi:hypothetical protein